MKINVNGIECDDLVYRTEKKNTIKVIDLLNKIARGEEVPKKIRYDGVCYSRGWGDYVGDEPITDCYYHNVFGSWFSNNNLTLDTEVEIIEEEKEIEKIPSWTCNVGRVDETNIEEYIHKLFSQQSEQYNKINELVIKVNKLKKEGK